jgi:signal transduction histidine kinase
MRDGRAWLGACLALLMLVACSSQPAANTDTPLTVDRAEAVQSDWNATAPPATGWTQVTLIDNWSARWPKHDGVVWYRLHWNQKDATAPVGLLVDYVSLADAIYVNGILIARDPSLSEPLSRSWIAPQYFLLASPVLHQGDNTLLVRVSGLSAYQPGFGTVSIGDPAKVQERYQHGVFERFNIMLVNLAMNATLGVVFLLMWLLRREDSMFGWFALTQLTISMFEYNSIASSTWPFASTDAFEAFNAAIYMAAGASYAMFLLRFGERRFPRIEKAMGAACIVAFGAAFLAPGWMGPHHNPWIFIGVTFFYLGIGWFLVRAWRVARADYRVLAICLMVPALLSLYDMALLLGWVHGDTYLVNLTSVFDLVSIAFVVSYRFVLAMRKVEGYNVELKREVEAATTQLGDTLARAHALELAHSRTGERLQLVRDLHDGFGGTLVGAIAQLEHGPDDTPKRDVVAMLKDMRDDLRLVIDSTAREHANLAELLIPLRHRANNLLEATGIDSEWHLAGIDGVELGSARSLDLLRLLQEALTNVFKHSSAKNVAVRVERIDDRMHLQVRDDGRGLPSASSAKGVAGGGAGFASMRLRARRLGGDLQIDSTGGGTDLRLVFPLMA